MTEATSWTSISVRLRSIAAVDIEQLMALAGLAFLSGLSFRSTFGSWSYLVTFLAAIALCALTWVGLAFASERYISAGFTFSTRLPVMLFALCLAGWLVTFAGSGPGSFLDALVGGWAELLTSPAPVQLTSQMKVVVFVVGWLAMQLGLEISANVGGRIPGFGALGAFASAVVAALLNEATRSTAVVQGAAMIVLLLVLARRDTRAAGNPVAPAIGWQRFTGGSAGPLAVSVGIVAALAVSLSLSDGVDDRVDLRSLLDRPWDAASEPSPLITIKRDLIAETAGEPVFVVRSEQPITRWTSAVLSSYNGVVWHVAQERPDQPADFIPVSPQLPVTPAIDGGSAGSASVEVLADLGPWVPHPSEPSVIDFAEPVDLRMHLETGTLAMPEGLNAGATYTLNYSGQTELGLSDLALRSLGKDPAMTELESLPGLIRDLAADVVQGKDGGARVVAIQNHFGAEGKYSLEDEYNSGHSFAEVRDFVADPRQLVGYEELYAATSGIVAREAGIPTRVVVGYKLEPGRFQNGEAIVVRGDASAWIEVLVAEVGWVPVDVTPDPSRVPDPDPPPPTDGQAVAPPNDPPPPPPPESDLPDDEDLIEPTPEATPEPTATPGGTAVSLPASPRALALGGFLLPLALVAGATTGGATLLSQRSRRRRSLEAPGDRVLAAWREVSDSFQAAGLVAPEGLTPLETAESIRRAVDPAWDAEIFDVVALGELAGRVRWGAVVATEHDAVAAWETVDKVQSALGDEVSWSEKLSAWLDPNLLKKEEEFNG